MALYPQDPEFKTVAAYLEFKTDLSESDTGHEQAVMHGGARVIIPTTYNSIPYQQALKLQGFLALHQGQAKTFDLILPVISSTLGDISGSTPRCNALTSNGNNQIALKDLAPNKTVKYSGEWLQFSGHDKAYQLTSDIISDGSGAAIATFEPSLYEQVLENEQIIIDQITFKVRAKSNIAKAKLSPGQKVSFSVNFVEAIR